ncbi:MAG TPA: hypothetical protein VFF73_06065 [Planctomycetota bacterium]|nr:hypothetical protein [Planctomycetota bacterium]
MTWPARGRVIPGEYEAVATLDSSRQPRSLRGAVEGPARSFRASAYVGDPEEDVRQEEAARRSLLASVSEVASLARACLDAAPLTTASDARAKTERRALLSRADARLDELERKLSAELPPVVFAPRLPDLVETVATTVRTFRTALRCEAWHDVDRGMEPPGFLDRSRRPAPPFVTLREVGLESSRVQAELESSRAAPAHGAVALDRLVRTATNLAHVLERQDGASDEERRASRARSGRVVLLARELAGDAAACALAGDAQTLKDVARGIEDALAAPTDEKRRPILAALVSRLAAIEGRVEAERARQRGRVSELARALTHAASEVRTLADRESWRRTLDETSARVAALPDRANELVPGARAQLDLAARALRARDGADRTRAPYLDSVARQALSRVRGLLPPE